MEIHGFKNKFLLYPKAKYSMKIIANPQEIQKSLIHAMKEYKYTRFAVAWASANHSAFKHLLLYRDKIINSSVGLHFYQTHPAFIKAFLNSETVQFITNHKGIFHPKVYLFYNDKNDFCCIIGSSNFTLSALSENDEVVSYIQSNDENMFLQIEELLDGYFEKASKFDMVHFEGYQNIWKQKQRYKEHLDDKFDSSKPLKRLYLSSILSLEWKEYYHQIKCNPRFSQRLKLLEKAQQYFQNYSFENIPEHIRRNIAGIIKKGAGINDWYLFGATRQAQFFGNRIVDSQKEISKALDKISFNEISKTDYLNCIKFFQNSEGSGYGISTVGRLLAMKRPDQFFALTGSDGKGKGNGKMLYQSFGITPLHTNDYLRYWEEIIKPVRQSPWYNSSPPSDPMELQAWNGRVALMDALFYDENT